MKNIPVIFFGVFVFASCVSDPASNEQEKTRVIEQSTTFLFCQSVSPSNEEMDIPTYEVFLQLAESKVKVADILNCETIPPDQFQQYQIPDTAINAVGGWWAGSGDYLYLIEEEGNYVVKKGEMYEEKEDNNYDYQVLGKFSKNGKKVF